MKKLLIFSLLLVLVFSLFTFNVSAATIGGTPPNPYDIWEDRTSYPYAYMYSISNPDASNAGQQYLIFCANKPFVSGTNLTFNSNPNQQYQYKLYMRKFRLSDDSLLDYDYWDVVLLGQNSFSLNTDNIHMHWSSDDIPLYIGTFTGTYFLASDGWQYEDEGFVGPDNPPPVEEDEDAGFLESIKNFVSKISDSILNLPKAISDLIKDALKEIFVPDTDYVQNAISSFSADLRNNLNIDTSAFENLFSDSKPVEDTYVDYEISGVGTMKLKVFDSYYLIQGVEYFRPIIRGFIVLLLLLYNVNQLIGFFGYNAGVVTGRNDHIKSAKEKQGE